MQRKSASGGGSSGGGASGDDEEVSTWFFGARKLSQLIKACSGQQRIDDGRFVIAGEGDPPTTELAVLNAKER
jgi:hypothetical protein